MDDQDRLAHRSPSRHKGLKRSLSEQPYTTGRQKKIPGRSLTQIFSHKPDSPRRGRSGSTGAVRKSSRDDNTSVIQAPEQGEYWSSSNFFTYPYTEVNSEDSWYSVVSEPSGHEHINGHVADDISQSLVLFGEGHSSTRHRSSVTAAGGRESQGTTAMQDRRTLVNVTGRKNEDATSSSCLSAIVKRGFKAVFWLVLYTFMLILAVICLTMFTVYFEAVCEQKRNTDLPLNSLKEQLYENVIGQALATESIVGAFREFSLYGNDVPFVLWMVGSTGSGKTHSTNILKNALSAVASVHVVISSFFHQRTEQDTELAELLQQLDSCSLNLVVIDGWDEGSDEPVLFVQRFLSHVQVSREERGSVYRIVVVLCGTKGSQVIDENYLSLRRNGKTREQVTAMDVLTFSSSYEEFGILNALTKHVRVIPFLPMEAAQVRQCIRRVLRETGQVQGGEADQQQRLISQVLRQVQFIHSPEPQVAATGCKRIHSLITILTATNSDFV